VPDRVLDWDGCLNVRDLGGHPTEDGGVTRFGRVVRADSIRQLTDSGWKAALDHGIRTAVDLRFRQELDDDPPGELPIDVVHLSLLGEPDEERWRELDRRAAELDDPAEATRFVYLEMLEHHGPQFAAAFAAIAEAKPGGVLVHCAGGKDRTGLVSAILLRLAGVAPAAVAADYALSERYLAPRHEQWLAEAADDTERERLRRLTVTPVAAMLGVLDELERRYGSAAAYLRAAGASDATLARVRVRLRDGGDGGAPAP
jgi:protein-tyrosine phosphatase